MPVSFAQLCEAVLHLKEVEQVPLQQDDGATKSAAVFLKQEPDFWQQLADMANHDAEGLGEILGVQPQIISQWYGRIQRAAQQARRAKAEKEKNEMIPTGV